MQVDILSHTLGKAGRRVEGEHGIADGLAGQAELEDAHWGQGLGGPCRRGECGGGTWTAGGLRQVSSCQGVQAQSTCSELGGPTPDPGSRSLLQRPAKQASCRSLHLRPWPHPAHRAAGSPEGPLGHCHLPRGSPVTSHHPHKHTGSLPGIPRCPWAREHTVKG